MKVPRGAHVVVMGVSGCGKSTLGSALAAALRREYLDADDLHPPGNLTKLRGGVALTDADRAPWLDAVADWMDAHPESVVACSALRRRYRDRLRRVRCPVLFVHLDPPRAVLVKRLAARNDHFMPASQLPDQLKALEALGPDEPGMRIEGAGEVDTTVEAVLARLEVGRDIS